MHASSFLLLFVINQPNQLCLERKNSMLGGGWPNKTDTGKQSIPDVIPAGVVGDVTTGAELDLVGTTRGAEEIAGTDLAGE